MNVLVSKALIGLWIFLLVCPLSGCGGVGQEERALKLQQIATGFADYHEKHKAFPRANGDHTDLDAGVPRLGLSWRVHLLPFLGEETLYRKFDLDQPWDSADNKKLVAAMPDIFRSNSSIPDGHTTFHLAVCRAETDPNYDWAEVLRTPFRDNSPEDSMIYFKTSFLRSKKHRASLIDVDINGNDVTIQYHGTIEKSECLVQPGMVVSIGQPIAGQMPDRPVQFNPRRVGRSPALIYEKGLLYWNFPSEGTVISAEKTAELIRVTIRVPQVTPRSCRLAEIIDTVELTILAAEYGDDSAQPWTKPGGVPYEELYSAITAPTFLAVFFDGKVCSVERSSRHLRSYLNHNFWLSEKEPKVPEDWLVLKSKGLYRR